MDTAITVVDYANNVDLQNQSLSTYKESIQATLNRLTQAMGSERPSLSSLGIDVNFRSLETNGVFELQSLGHTVVGKLGVRLEPLGADGYRFEAISTLDFWHQENSHTPPRKVGGFSFNQQGRTDIVMNGQPAWFNAHTLMGAITEVFVRLVKKPAA
jgi:hypothetical protein